MAAHEKGDDMTDDEAAMLRGYLRRDAPAFEEWLRSTRDGSSSGEGEYKTTLAEARAWDRGFQEGAKACAAWTEEQEDSALTAEALSRNSHAAEGGDAKLDGPPAGPVQR